MYNIILHYNWYFCLSQKRSISIELVCVYDYALAECLLKFKVVAMMIWVIMSLYMNILICLSSIKRDRDSV